MEKVNFSLTYDKETDQYFFNTPDALYVLSEKEVNKIVDHMKDIIDLKYLPDSKLFGKL